MRSPLCWNVWQTDRFWQRSPDNSFWRPRLSHYPETRLLQAGDIILCQPVSPTPIQRLIQTYQGGLYTHAAVYLQSDHIICEASPSSKEVRYASLEDLLPGNCTLFRRVRDLDVAGRMRIAEMAVKLVSYPYGFGSIFRDVLERTTSIRLSHQAPDPVTESLICSSLCEHAIMAASASRIYLTKRRGHLIMPEDLAATAALEDVEIGWSVVQLE